MGSERAAGQEPTGLGIEMLPVAMAGLRAELSEARGLARELAGMTPAQADSAWCDQLEDEYQDVGAAHAEMVRQLARWRLDHPHAPGLDELAELVADVEPVRHALLRQLALLRCARGTSGTRVLPGRPPATLIRDEPQWTYSPDCAPRALHVWREGDTHLVAIVATESPEGGVPVDAVAARLRAEYPDSEIELFAWTPSAVPGGGDRFDRFDRENPPTAEQVCTHDVIDRLGAGHRYRCRCQS
ncbi:hypothetical protein SAMN04488074_107264 [Lentzea albidocapillata subsp. violacea]|uniref:Uncharacterized protein n=1 Tax=Lentzea albidocapillata subsp. violacea TaxID=128104 RepID=A0A1G9F631_9PSEU|nr:hypothetical protein [Lentzea albidocapillata]SDK83842.1 hypothetical protein SAMN04488074_107264 [Lentzea albidocapillata subsp. violacea]